MPDYSETFIPKLALPSKGILKESADVMLPNYGGYSLSNIPATISHWLDGPQLGHPMLSPQILEKLADRYQKVVFVLVDALGLSHLQRLMHSGKAGFWQEMLERAQLFPLTSVSPSTTATALTTLWTGVDPSTHGYIGYEMWLKEYGMVVNTILHTPITYNGDVGGLSRTGFEAESFLGLEPMGAQLARHGIDSHAFLPYGIGNSGLSRMHLAKTALHGYVTESDLWVGVCDTLNARPNRKRYIYVYWSILDTLIHRFGPNDARVDNAFEAFTRSLQVNLMDGLESWTKQDTLLVLSADHGAIPTPPDANYDLKNHPELVNMLRIMPTCEGRLPFLYLKQGEETAVRSYFDAAWPGKFEIISRAEALALHLFGDGSKNPALVERIGDLVVIPHGNAYLWWPTKPNVMQGRHGGLHPDEMLIPFYGLPLA